MTEIDYASPALGPVRARVSARIEELKEINSNPRTPLELVPGHRGEIVALKWLLDQLKPPQEIIT